MSMKQYFIAVWICISLISKGDEHLFMHPLAICVSYLEKTSCKSFLLVVLVIKSKAYTCQQSALLLNYISSLGRNIC